MKRNTALDKPYRLLVKIKNNRLWSAIVRQFPEVRTQSDAARAMNIHVTTLGLILNMKVWPYSMQHGWSPVAKRIAMLLRETEDYLFDSSLYGKAPIKGEIILELGVDKLIEERLTLLNPPKTPEEEAEASGLRDALRKSLAMLMPREEQVITMLFGLRDGREMTLEEVGQRFAVGKERIHQIKIKALRKLQHPARTRILKDFIYNNIDTYVIDPDLDKSFLSEDL